MLVGAVQGLSGPFAFGEGAVCRTTVRRLDRGVAVSRAVDVSGGCVEDACVLRTGRVEGVYRPQYADLERLDGQGLVVAHARGRREVVNLVAADAECVDDVVADVPEFRVRRHVAQQRRIGGVAYVHAEDFVPVVQQTQAQVGADESHAAQYDYSLLHFLPFYRGKSKIHSIPAAIRPEAHARSEDSLSGTSVAFSGGSLRWSARRAVTSRPPQGGAAACRFARGESKIFRPRLPEAAPFLICCF